MKQKMKNLVLALVPVAMMLAGPVLAESFDTSGYLQHCTDRVPIGSYALPMDKLCVSTAVRLCDLASEQNEQALCLSKTTEWLVEDVEMMKAAEGALAGLSAQLPEGGMMAGLLGAVEKPDCSEISVPSVPNDLVCDYARALGEWHKARTMARSLRNKMNK